MSRFSIFHSKFLILNTDHVFSLVLYEPSCKKAGKFRHNLKKNLHETAVLLCIAYIVFQIAFMNFRHFSLAHPAAAVYICVSDFFLIYEPDVQALRCDRHLRDTDRDGV